MIVIKFQISMRDGRLCLMMRAWDLNYDHIISSEFTAHFVNTYRCSFNLSFNFMPPSIDGDSKTKLSKCTVYYIRYFSDYIFFISKPSRLLSPKGLTEVHIMSPIAIYWAQYNFVLLVDVVSIISQ